MPIKIKFDKEKSWYPIIVCDTCGKQVEKMGNVVYAHPLPNSNFRYQISTADLSKIKFYHKGKCDYRDEIPWDDIQDFLEALLSQFDARKR